MSSTSVCPLQKDVDAWSSCRSKYFPPLFFSFPFFHHIIQWSNALSEIEYIWPITINTKKRGIHRWWWNCAFSTTPTPHIFCRLLLGRGLSNGTYKWLPWQIRNEFRPWASDDNDWRRPILFVATSLGFRGHDPLVNFFTRPRKDVEVTGILSTEFLVLHHFLMVRWVLWSIWGFNTSKIGNSPNGCDYR